MYTREEVRWFRLFVSIIFFVQAVIQTILYGFHDIQLLWVAVVVVSVGLWLLETIITAIIDLGSPYKKTNTTTMILPTVYQNLGGSADDDDYNHKRSVVANFRFTNMAVIRPSMRARNVR